MGQSVLPEGGTGDGLLVRLLEGIGLRIRYYPTALWRMIKAVFRIVWFILWPLTFVCLILGYFIYAVYTGKVFPISGGGRITDHGKPIGWLGGGIPQIIGRILALPILAVVGVGIWLGDLSPFVFLVVGAQIMVWLGFWPEAGENFLPIVWVCSGLLGIASMSVLAMMFWLRRAWGLRDLWDMIWNNKQPEMDKPEPQVRRDDDILVKRIEDSMSDIAEKSAANIIEAIASLLPWRR